MNIHDAVEAAYKNGYEKGLSDGRKQEWISVKDKLPDIVGGVLVRIETPYKDDVLDLYYYCGDNIWETGKYMASTEYLKITHWVLLPDPPKMKDGEINA